MLRKSPGFTVAAVLTLALGDRRERRGLQHHECVHPAPAECAPCGEPLRTLAQANDDCQQSYPNYLDLRDRNHSFEDLVAYNITHGRAGHGRKPIRRWIEEASGNYFDALGIQPYLGHFFHASDEHGPEQRSVYRAHLRVLAHPFSG